MQIPLAVGLGFGMLAHDSARPRRVANNSASPATCRREIITDIVEEQPQILPLPLRVAQGQGQDDRPFVCLAAGK